MSRAIDPLCGAWEMQVKSLSNFGNFFLAARECFFDPNATPPTLPLETGTNELI